MSEYVFVTTVDKLPDPGKEVFEVSGHIVALFHVSGTFYCLEDTCTHDNGPLADGKLDGYSIACTRHGAKFDIRTGKNLCLPATSPTRVHEVKEEEGKVYIRINED
ncbi:MAG: non-heme iron oxygenase ferredoxin subunit [Pirellulaceae bacterium]|nr:non-heme iron oxygenase ferredoxin subunit [Pirellulaceae bacterium]